MCYERAAHIASEAYRDIILYAGFCAVNYPFKDYAAVLLRDLRSVTLFESKHRIWYRRR